MQLWGRFAVVAGIQLLMLAAQAADFCSLSEQSATELLAVDDVAFTSAAGTAVRIPVLANDYLPSGVQVKVTVGGASRGQVAVNGDNTISYTPSVLGEDTFSYTISDMSPIGAAPAMAKVDVHPSTSVSIDISGGQCRNGQCTLIARPTVTENIKSFGWKWGDGGVNEPVKILPAIVLHQYPLTGEYTASVTVTYFSGEAITATRKVMPIFEEHATWTLLKDGLTVTFSNIDLSGGTNQGSTFPPGSTVEVNWSPNASDCPRGCGTNWDNIGSCWQSPCSIGGRYYRSGTYAATLRFLRPAKCGNGIDDDGDGLIDFFGVNGTAADPQCASQWDNDETSASSQPSVALTHSTSVSVTNNPPVISTLQIQRSDIHPYERRFYFWWDFQDEFSDEERLPAFWDLGDGATKLDSEEIFSSPVPHHVYANAGAYTVSLKTRDSEGAEAVLTREVQVVNTPPVAKITVECQQKTCAYSADMSLDDGRAIRDYAWTFGDGVRGSGETSTHDYAADGCYTVGLTVTDDAGASSYAEQKISIASGIFARGGGVTVDAHASPLPAGISVNGDPRARLEMTTGDLNGILEPGETVVVEPNWPRPATADVIRARALIGGSFSIEDSAYEWKTRDGLATYASASVPAGPPPPSGTSASSATVTDCWTAQEMRCYSGELKLKAGATRNPQITHRDVQFDEYYQGTSTPTPGSRLRLHVGESFPDVPRNHWAYAAIESVLHAGYSSGCGSGRFCPGDALSRAQIAIWLIVARFPGEPLPACVPPGPFLDVPCSYWAAQWIAQLKAKGLTTGVDGQNYAPDSTLTRAELAAFLVKTLSPAGYEPPACSADFFDVTCPAHWAAKWISEAKRRGYSPGCAPNEYCPDRTVDRAQAAVMFTKAFGVALNAEACGTGIVKYDVVPGYTPPTPIQELTFSPVPAVAPTVTVGVVRLPWPTATTVQVPLTSSNPAVASVPASVTVNAGQSTGAFNVTPAAVGARATVTISATLDGYTKTATLDVCTPAPAISVQPASRTINAGQSATLSTTAGGAGTLTYQWYEGTAPATTTPVGTSSNTYTTPALTAAKSYWVKVSNACGSVNSSTATVTVCAAPGISVQPQSQTISGGTATLSVTASGSGPFAYQWYEGPSGTTTTPVGSNSSTYTTPSLAATKSYWVRVTSTCNGSSAVDSNTATIAVASQIARRQLASNAAVGATSVTATWPQATQANSLLVAVVSASSTGFFGDFVVPSGWQLAKLHQLSNVKTAIYYYPNHPGGRTSETFGTTVARDQILQLVEYTGAAVSPVDRTATAGGAATDNLVLQSGTTPLTSQPKELVVTAMSMYVSTSIAFPTNFFTMIHNRFIGSRLTTAVHERIVSFAGTYGHEATAEADGVWLGMTVTFRAANTQ